jgi:hypothetical protein
MARVHGYLEWIEGDHLRHAKFGGIREDKDARNVTKEHAGEAYSRASTMSNLSGNSTFRSYRLCLNELLQLCVFQLGLLQDGNAGVGVFPEGEEILIGSLRLGIVPLEGERAGQA